MAENKCATRSTSRRAAAASKRFVVADGEEGAAHCETGNAAATSVRPAEATAAMAVAMCVKLVTPAAMVAAAGASAEGCGLDQSEEAPSTGFKTKQIWDSNFNFKLRCP